VWSIFGEVSEIGDGLFWSDLTGCAFAGRTAVDSDR